MTPRTRPCADVAIVVGLPFLSLLFFFVATTRFSIECRLLSKAPLPSRG